MAAVSRAQLDQLGQRLRADDVPTPGDAALYDAYRAEFAEALSEVDEILDRVFDPATIRASRLKTLESTVAKLRRGTFRLSQINDIAGWRIVVEDLDKQDYVLEVLRAAFPDCRINDYRDRPQFGYRAAHVIVTAPTGKLVEVQVRSKIQNRWANLSEALARDDIKIKYGGGSDAARRYLDEMSNLGRQLELKIRAGARLVAEMESLSERLEHGDPVGGHSTQRRAEVDSERARFDYLKNQVNVVIRDINDLTDRFRDIAGPAIDMGD